MLFTWFFSSSVDIQQWVYSVHQLLRECTAQQQEGGVSGGLSTALPDLVVEAERQSTPIYYWPKKKQNLYRSMRDGMTVNVSVPQYRVHLVEC